MSKQQGWTTCPMTKEYVINPECMDYSWEELVTTGCGDQYDEDTIDVVCNEEYEL